MTSSMDMRTGIIRQVAVWLTLFIAVRLFDLGIFDVSLVSSLVDATTTDIGSSAHFQRRNSVNGYGRDVLMAVCGIW